MVDVDSITGDDMRALFVKKPELFERLLGITMDKSTLKDEHWIDVHPGRQKIDFVFQDTEGKHYMVKIALRERPLAAVRHPNIWQKRWAEVNQLDENIVVPVLIIDEETVKANPRNQKDLDEFGHVTTIQYKIPDMVKEIGT